MESNLCNICWIIDNQIIIIPEMWRDVKGYGDRYEISSWGNIKNKIRDTFLSKQFNHKGYVVTRLYSDDIKRQKTNFIHRLMAIAFIPNPLNLPQVNHEDGDKINNRLWNFGWCDQFTNMRHAVLHGLRPNYKGENHPGHKLKEKDVLEIKALFDLGFENKQISELYIVSVDCIKDIRNGRSWIHLN